MKILAIGAHFDDIELNCLGTLLRAKDEGAEIYLAICTDGNVEKLGKKRIREQYAVNERVKYEEVFYLDYKDGTLWQNSKLIFELEVVVDLVQPDYVFTHSEDDFHQDHVAVSKCVWAVNRYSRFSIFAFPSQDVKQPFPANCYIDISKYFKKKLKILKKFKSQQNKPWLSEEWITSRNVGINDSKHMEKFYIRFLKI